MKKNILYAKQILIQEGYTCVLLKEKIVYTSTKRGVKPLLQCLESEQDFRDFSAADKVVGKAAAFLYVLLGVQNVYAHVISEVAKEVLEKYGILVEYDTCVERIINRDGTGFCPMEEAVIEIDTPEKALSAIYKKLEQLTN